MPSAVHVLSERRAAPRFSVDQSLEILGSDGKLRSARLLDVSIDGARIAEVDGIPDGLMQLRFRAGGAGVEILARSVRTTSDGFAVEFVEVTIDALARYSRWLDGLMHEELGQVSSSS